VTQDRKHGSELDDRIGSALADWPPRDAESVRRDPSAAGAASATWDEAAKEVTARIAAGAHATKHASISRLTDDALLAAPLGAEPGEVGAQSKQSVDADRNAHKSTVEDVPGRRPGSISPPSSGIVREAIKMTTQSEQRQRERTSFKDLARLAATPPPSSVAPVSSGGSVGGGGGSWTGGMSDAGLDGPRSSSGPAATPQHVDPNDSGLVDLKLIATADPRAPERAKTTQLAASGLFDEDPPPPPLSARISAAPSSMGMGMGVEASAQAESAPISMHAPHAGVASNAPPSISARAMMGSDTSLPTKKGKGGILLVLGGVITLAAAAAGGVFYVKTHHIAGLSASKPATADVQPAAQPAAAAPAVAATEAATVASNDTPPADTASEPETISAAQKDEPKSKGGSAKHGGGKAVAAKPEAKSEAKPEAPPAAPPKKADTKTAAAPTSTTELGSAMQKAAGPADAVAVEEKPSGPQFAPGSVPQKPANGTVMGAIGAALPTARACLGPDDPVSRATITFQSTGAVQSVNVAGGAAGKPAEACIKTALGKAKVPPFAEATFTTAITVRP
jgi:hypothetical protein